MCGCLHLVSTLRAASFDGRWQGANRARAIAAGAPDKGIFLFIINLNHK